MLDALDWPGYGIECKIGQSRGRLARPHRGALAQLVARFHGMEEVRGSSPLSSTIERMFEYLTDTETRESAFLLFNRFYAVPLLIVSNKGIMWVRVPFPHKSSTVDFIVDNYLRLWDMY